MWVAAGWVANAVCIAISVGSVSPKGIVAWLKLVEILAGNQAMHRGPQIRKANCTIPAYLMLKSGIVLVDARLMYVKGNGVNRRSAAKSPCNRTTRDWAYAMRTTTRPPI